MKKTAAIIAFILLALTVGRQLQQWSDITSVNAQSAFCDESIAISVAASMSQTIIGGLNGETVRVCAIVITADTIATTATFASAGTNITGAMRLCDECDISVGNGTGVILEGSRDGNLTITAATGAVTGFVRLGRN